MKTIGILGGLGPQATVDLIQRIHRASQALIAPKANSGYPPLVVWFLNHPPMDPEESTGDRVVPHPGFLAAARSLGAVCDFLIIPSNTPHLFADAVEQASGRPLLSMIRLTVDSVLARKPRRVGIVAAGMGTPNYHAMYERALDAAEVPWTGIHGELAGLLDASIFGVMEGRDPATVRDPADRAVAELRTAGCDLIILGCTEIPLLLGDPADPDVVNPAELLARAAVEHAIREA